MRWFLPIVLPVLIGGLLVTSAPAQISWTKNIISETETDVRLARAADLNLDGYMDVVATIDYNSVDANANDLRICLNDGSMGFGRTLIPNDPNGSDLNITSFCLKDLDEDGDMDILTAPYSGAYGAAHLNDGSGSFSINHILAVSPSFDIQTCDIDRDGYLDFIHTAGNQQFFLRDGNGSGGYTVITAVDVGSSFLLSYDPHDIDGDGDIDVATLVQSASGKVSWWENNGSESFTEHVLNSNYANGSQVRVVDLDGDGDMDLLAARDGAYLSWFQNDGSESFTESTIAGGSGTLYFETGDLDRDGNLDLATIYASSAADVLSWWENDGSESFTAHEIENYVDVGGAHEFTSIQIVDMDLDGDDDLLVVDMAADDLLWYENDTDPLGSTITYSVPQNQWVMFGIPVQVSDGAWTTLFADDVSGSAGSDWRLSQWDHTNSTFVRYGEADSPTDLGTDPPDFAPGQGFWFYQTEASPLTLDITSAQISGATNDGWPCSIPLDQGATAFTQVANPFYYGIDWRNMRLHNSANERTWSIYEASLVGRMNSYAYTYDGATEQWVNIESYGDGSGIYTLDAWEGFYVYQTDGTNSYALHMVPRNYMAQDGPLPGTDFELDEPGAFTLPLQLHLADSTLADLHNRIGVHSASSDQYDWLDAFEHTPRTSSFVQLLFQHPEYEEHAGNYSYDHRSLDFPDGHKTWHMTARTWRLPNRDVVLTWPGIEAIDESWQFFLQTEEDEVVDMRRRSELRLQTGEGDISTWELAIVVTRAASDTPESAASTGQPTAFEIAAIQPNPFNDQARITLHFDEPTHARLEIYNLAGQRVATLLEGPVTRGSHQLTWCAREVASGVYLFRLEAQGQSVVKKATLLR